MNWYLSLPPAQAQVPCGTQAHAVRWESGQIVLPAHPDAEAELVLAALGGDKPRCVEVAETWAGHASDLDVLMTGPRSLADQVTVGWDDVEEHQANWFGLPAGRSKNRPVKVATRAGLTTSPGRLARLPENLLRRVQARIEVLHLLALGPAFQFRLAGTVAAAWTNGPDATSRRPELTAALAGRVAPAIAEWLGINPDLVSATLLEPRAPSWGGLEVTGSDADRRVRVSLPVGWLASVWACGLAVVDGHLVVAVEEPGWPWARVLALAEPAAAPVSVAVTGTDDGTLPRWRIARAG
jgi:hypothetical protein